MREGDVVPAPLQSDLILGRLGASSAWLRVRPLSRSTPHRPRGLLSATERLRVADRRPSMPLQVYARRPHCWLPKGNRPCLDTRSFRRVPPLRQRAPLIAQLRSFSFFLIQTTTEKSGSRCGPFIVAILPSRRPVSQLIPSRY